LPSAEAAWFDPAVQPSSYGQAGRAPLDGPLRLVIVLMFVNLGLSVVLTGLMLAFHQSVVDYEIAHMNLGANADPSVLATVRKSLDSALWGRLGGVVVVSLVYVWRAFALRRGSRSAYLRLQWLCGAGLVGIVYLIVAANYPVWMRVEQVLQGVVLIALLVAVNRAPVRARFARRPAVPVSGNTFL
jgi:hypothetical protein